MRDAATSRPVNDTRAITAAMVRAGARDRRPGAAPDRRDHRGQKGAELTEMADLKDAGAVAVTDDGRCVTSSAVMRRALEYASTFDLPVIQHAEDHALTEGAQMHEGAVATRLSGCAGWPRVAEDIIVARDVLLAEATGARYHVAHISSLGRRAHPARGEGARDRRDRRGDAAPPHAHRRVRARLRHRLQGQPAAPRGKADVEALRGALADGTIDAIATDHAPHSSLEKDCEFAEASPGMIGLELVVPVLLGLVRRARSLLARLVDALTRAPRASSASGRLRSAKASSPSSRLVDPKAAFVGRAARLDSEEPHTPFLGEAARGRVRMSTPAGARIVQRCLASRLGAEKRARPAATTASRGRSTSPLPRAEGAAAAARKTIHFVGASAPEEPRRLRGDARRRARRRLRARRRRKRRRGHRRQHLRLHRRGPRRSRSTPSSRWPTSRTWRRCRRLVVVAGYLSQRHPEELAARDAEVDHFLGSSDMLKLGEVLRAAAEQARWITSPSAGRLQWSGAGRARPLDPGRRAPA